IQKFCGEGGLGPQLQEGLERRARHLNNWIYDWWVQWAYLESRQPLPMHSNPAISLPKWDFSDWRGQPFFPFSCFLHSPFPNAPGVDPCLFLDFVPVCLTILPALTTSLSAILYLLDSDLALTFLPVHYRSLAYPFGLINIVRLQPSCFQLDVYNSDGSRMTERQIHAQGTLLSVLHLLTFLPCSPSFSYTYKLNKESVRAIEKGLFTLCLDSPVMRVSDDRHSSRMAAQILHVGGTHLNSGNRWFDKTLQFVVGEDDSWGLLYEQATAEGPPIATLPDHILQYCKKPDPKKTPLIPLQMPKKLINDLDIRCFDFQRFGKELPKRHNVSPNSFIQVALQLAYYKVHNEVCASCDIASQRMFRGGRTDYIRSPTNQMLKFVLAFDDPTISLELLRKAVETYVALTDQVLKGQSIDRHLLGLKLQAIEEGLSVSRLFMDTAYGITPVEVDSIATFIPMTGNDYVISR
uniref:Carnitine O-acetyltransferase b n=1 Tax=Salmo trutta TaxID=8032 RepID=A0A674EII1_SALTR